MDLPVHIVFSQADPSEATIPEPEGICSFITFAKGPYYGHPNLFPIFGWRILFDGYSMALETSLSGVIHLDHRSQGMVRAVKGWLRREIGFWGGKFYCIASM
jgi:hypothetical protein